MWCNVGYSHRWLKSGGRKDQGRIQSGPPDLDHSVVVLLNRELEACNLSDRWDLFSTACRKIGAIQCYHFHGEILEISISSVIYLQRPSGVWVSQICAWNLILGIEFPNTADMRTKIRGGGTACTLQNRNNQWTREIASIWGMNDLFGRRKIWNRTAVIFLPQGNVARCNQQMELCRHVSQNADISHISIHSEWMLLYCSKCGFNFGERGFRGGSSEACLPCYA